MKKKIVTEMKLPFEYLDLVYITSDSHYMHKNITRGTTTWDDSRMGEGNTLRVRDFDTPEEMSQAMVDNFNSILPKNAILFHCGDWSFGGKENISRFRKMLNVEELHLITGNHDKYICKGLYDDLFTTRQSDMKLSIGSLAFHLYHHPIQSWDGLGRGTYHLHGHQHWVGDRRFGNGRMMDIGVDGNDLKPYKLTDVVAMLHGRVHVPIAGDHHAFNK